jgi:hypothetical protein
MWLIRVRNNSNKHILKKNPEIVTGWCDHSNNHIIHYINQQNAPPPRIAKDLLLLIVNRAMIVT